MFDLIAPYFRALYDTTGINFIFLYERYEYDKLVRGMLLSILLSICCITLSIVIGVVGAWAQGAPSRVVRAFVGVYVQLFRNTPPFVQLLFFYFSLGPLTPQIDAGGYSQPLISSFDWAVIGLGCFGGALNAEIFRAGIESVPLSTREATEALGYNRSQAFIYIILPLAVRYCLPALTNNLVSLVKTTSLAYAIAVPEVTYVANQIWSDNINVGEMMVVLFLFFNILVGVLVWGMRALEHKLKMPGYA